MCRVSGNFFVSGVPAALYAGYGCRDNDYLAWLLIGAIGVPVLPGGSAGLGRLLGPTGGFYVCFAIAAWLMSKLLNGSNSFKRMVFLGIAVGMPIIYVGGCVSMYLVAHMDVWATLVAAVFPFIFGDVVKVLAGAFLATRINMFLRLVTLVTAGL